MLVIKFLFTVLVLVNGFSYPSLVVELFKDAPTIVVFNRNPGDMKGDFTCITKSLQIPVIIISHRILEISKFIHKDFIAVVFLSEPHWIILETVFRTVENVKSSRLVFIFSNNLNNRKVILLPLFHQCFKKGMLNVLALVGDGRSDKGTEIFSYVPFPNFKLLNMTNVKNIQDFFPDKVKNLYGYPTRTVFRYDYPRSYLRLSSQGSTSVEGYLGKMIFTFAVKYNTSLTGMDPKNKFNKYNVAKMVAVGEIDLAPNFIITIEGRSRASYPLGIVNVIVVIPQPKKIPRYLYLLRPFDLGIWIVLGVFLFYAGVVEFISGKVTLARLHLIEAFTNILLGLLYQGINRRVFNQWRFSIIHGQIIVLGLILVNFYLAYLSSYLTVTLYDKPAETYDKIRSTGLKIMAENRSLELYTRLHCIPDEYEDLYFAVDVEDLLSHIRSLNTSYAYALSMDRVNLLKNRQSFFRKPLLVPTNIFITQYAGTCPVSRDWILGQKFDEFICDVLAYGLRDKWLKDVSIGNDENVSENYRLEFDSDEAVKATTLKMDHLMFSWYCLILGLLTACVCFLFEIVAYLLFELYFNVN